MKKEEILKLFQKHMGYTDQEMEIFVSNPRRLKMVTETPDFVKSRLVAEVLESHGCAAQHKVGDKFVMTPGGELITEECPKRICISAVSAINSVLPAVYDRLISGSDPGFERTNTVQCGDIGLDKGGFGKILLEVRLEKI